MSNANHYPSNQKLCEDKNPCGDDLCTDQDNPSLCCLYHADALARHAAQGCPDQNSCRELEKIVLSTQGLMQSIDAGVANWVVDLNAARSDEEIAALREQLGANAVALRQPGIIASPFPLITSTPDHVTLEAYWQNMDVLKARNIKLNVGTHANVFGGVGMLRVQSPDPTGLKIPTVTANPENVRYYGASLIHATDVPEHTGLFQVASANRLVFMAYTYESSYVSDFLTQPCGGGGYFVEHHDFPHIHMPLSATECGGHIVLGKPIATVGSGDNEVPDFEDPDQGYTRIRFAFTAFRIPYGYALYSPSNTIHGDGTLIGPYAITVANASTPADTVLFYRWNPQTRNYERLKGLVDQ